MLTFTKGHEYRLKQLLAKLQSLEGRMWISTKKHKQPHNKTPQTKHNGLLPRPSCQLFSSFLTLQNLVENLLNPGLKQDSTCILQDITCIW